MAKDEAGKQKHNARGRTAARSTWWHFKSAFLLVPLLGLCALYFRQQGYALSPYFSRKSDPKSIWQSLVPSEDIHWSPCFDEYLCARLQVPLDYLSDPDTSPKATIALQMLPASHPNDTQGTLFLGAGGPGMPGTDMMLRYAKPISRIVGGTYSILGFDARGTGASTPNAQCFPSELQYKALALQARRGLLNLSDDSVPMARAWEQLVGQKCEETLGGVGKEEPGADSAAWGGGRFMSSASIATDMITILNKLGQDALHYWGFSYGAMLGQYFASMYPDRVGRVMLDGACDAELYRQALWNHNLPDTDAVADSFFAFCHAAGSEKCALYEPSVDAIRARVDAIHASIRAAPIPLPGAPSPALFTEAALEQLSFQALYVPVRFFPMLVGVLVAAERRDPDVLTAFAPLFAPALDSNTAELADPTAANDAFSAIACGDGDPVAYDPASHAEHYAALAAHSPRFARLWGSLYLRCTEWRMRPKWRYTGAFGAANTSGALLVASLTHDTACPLSQARVVHARFPGAALLVQESFGHCVPSAPSVCTGRHIRAFFRDGSLPAEGTMCGADELPFVGETVEGKLEESDRQLLDVLKEFARCMP